MKAELRISRIDKKTSSPQIQKDLKTQKEINTKKTTRHKVKKKISQTLRLKTSLSFLPPQTTEARKQQTL